MNLKVQFTDGRRSIAGLINSGLTSEGVLTFHAYSDTMKARLLEKMAHGYPIKVFPTNEKPRNGEWFEPKMS